MIQRDAVRTFNVAGWNILDAVAEKVGLTHVRFPRGIKAKPGDLGDPPAKGKPNYLVTVHSRPIRAVAAQAADNLVLATGGTAAPGRACRPSSRRPAPTS